VPESASITSNLGFPIDVCAVAFDLDGTLADTLPDLFASANLMLRDLGRRQTERETVRAYIGQGIDKLVERLLGDEAGAELAPELRNRAGGIFREHYRENLTRESSLFPGTEQTLLKLRGSGVKLACVTNKTDAFTRPLLAGLGVLDLFDEVICGDTLARKKPDPLPLTWCAERFGIAPARLLMVGDSQTDTLCARAAGCPVVCVPFGYRSGMELHELDCDAIVPAVSNLFELIRLPRS
jgi:phosphoglycolate phosphatase